MKKLILLLMLLSLLGAGCTEDGKAITQAAINSLDIQSQQGRSVLWVEMSAGAEEEFPPEALQALQQGIVLEYIQQSEDSMMMEIKLPQAVELPVPGAAISSISMYIDGEIIYLGIFPDDPYLKIEPKELYATLGMTSPFEMPGFTNFTTNATERDRNFIKSYIEIFGFKLPKVINHGAAHLTLPDGNVDATHYQLNLNEVELKNMLLYILKDLQNNKLIEDYLMETLGEMAEFMGEELSLEEFEEEFLEEFREGIDVLIMGLESFDVSELGVKVAYDTHSWIDDQGYARKTLTEILIAEEDLFNEYIKLVSETEVWNINKPVTINFPQNYITLAEIIEDETVIMNTKLYEVIEFLESPIWFGGYDDFWYDEPIFVVFELDDPIYYLNWELEMMEVAPYVQEGEVFVPLYVIADIIGAQLVWNNETREAFFFDGVNEILVPVDKPEVVVNSQLVDMSVPVHLNSDRIMIPVNFISEVIDAEVAWLEETGEILFILY